MNQTPNYSFFSDNCAGACPAALREIYRVNAENVASYGNDPTTRKVEDLLQKVFGRECTSFFVFNGTAANALAISAMCRSHHAIICHELAHIETDECSAPEHFTGGVKLMPTAGESGKLKSADIECLLNQPSDCHRAKVAAISLTQATELGTVYSIEELRSISSIARLYGLPIHVDGSRLANALVTLGCTPQEFVEAAGVDVLCLGGTKNGLLGGEAIVFFNQAIAKEFAYLRKQAGQLASKMRFLSSQWLGLLANNGWLCNARHANRMAQLLATKLFAATGLECAYPCQANSVFVCFPIAIAAALRNKGWTFLSWPNGIHRLMCSWATSCEQIDQFVLDCASSFGNAADGRSTSSICKENG